MRYDLLQLWRSIKDIGFSGPLLDQLNPAEYENHFPIQLKESIQYDHDTVDYILNLQWHKENNQYHIDSIQGTLRKELHIPGKVTGSDAKEKYEISHTFKMETLLYASPLEMYHLLDGRSVEKDLPQNNMKKDFTPGYMKLLPNIDNCQSLTWIAGSFESEEQREIRTKVNSIIDPDKLKEFIDKVEKMGFKGYGNYIMRNAQNGLDSFVLQLPMIKGKDKIYHSMKVSLNIELQTYEATNLESILIKEIRLPDEIVAGIDINMLDETMRQISWGKNDFWQNGNVFPFLFDTTESLLHLKAVSALRDLDKLMNCNEYMGGWIGTALYMKHLRFTPNEYNFVNNYYNPDRYQIKCNFDIQEFSILNLQKIENLLNGRAVLNKVSESGDEWISIIPWQSELKPEKRIRPAYKDWPAIFTNSGIFGMEHLGRSKNYEDPIKRPFEDGDIVCVDLAVKNEIQNIGFQIDQFSHRVVIVPFEDNSKEFVQSLQHNTGLDVAEISYLAVGQVRDYSLFPMPINDLNWMKNLRELEKWGFNDFPSAQLKVYMQTAYNTFAIEVLGNDASEKIEANVHFRMVKQSEYELYQLNLKRRDMSGNVLFDLPFYLADGYIKNQNFDFKEMCNLVFGRSVYRELSFDGREIKKWYYLDLDGITTNGSYEIKAIPEFNLKLALENIALIDITDIKGMEIIERELMKGNKIDIPVTEANESFVYSISAYPPLRDIMIHSKRDITKVENIPKPDPPPPYQNRPRRR